MVLQSNPDLEPVDLSPRVLVYRREEDEFYPTRQGAMQTSRITGGSLSGSTQQSLRLKFEELEALNRNVDSLSVLLSSVQEIDWKPTKGARGYVAKIDSDRVIEFIQNFELHHSPSMDPDSIVRHIRREQQLYGDLNQWSLAVFSPGQNHESRLDRGVFSSLPTVPNVTQRGVSQSGKLEVLLDKVHLFVDILDFTPAGCERSRANARLYRPSSRGLLAVYILDGQYEPDTEGSSHNFRSMFSEANGPDVVAYGIVLPESSHQTPADEYYVAEGVGVIHDGVDLE